MLNDTNESVHDANDRTSSDFLPSSGEDGNGVVEEAGSSLEAGRKTWEIMMSTKDSAFAGWIFLDI